MFNSKKIEVLNEKISELEERIKKLEWKEPASLEDFVEKNKYKRICDLERLDYEWFDKKFIGWSFYNEFPFYMGDGIKYFPKTSRINTPI